MSTLEYTISMLETMPEDKLREVQKYIQYHIFKDMGDMPMESFNEDIIVRQLTESMKKSDMGYLQCTYESSSSSQFNAGFR